MIEVTLRIVFSLVVVLGLMWVLARLVRRPLTGRTHGVLAVLGRQQLSRNSSVAVLRVGERALILGVTDQQVTLLGESDPATFEVHVHAGGEVREPVSIDDLAGAPRSPLAGSLLSPATWRQAAVALRKGRAL